MRLPTDLTHEIADRVEPPGFDAVLTRARAARQRRRRTTIASGLAAACVVGGLAFAVGDPLGSDDNSPQPAPPGPSETYDGSSQVDPRLPEEVRDLLGEDRIDPWAVAGSGGGVAVLWRACPEDDCRFALTTRVGEFVNGTLVDATNPRLSEVPGGWLLEDNSGFSRITPTGESEQIYDTGPGTGDVMAGDTAVETSQGWRLLRGDKIIPIPSWLGRTTLGAYVTPAGHLIVAVAKGLQVLMARTDDGEHWVEQAFLGRSMRITRVILAGHGDHVSAAFLGDDPDGTIPTRSVHFSVAGGEHNSLDQWLDGALDEEVQDLSSVAVSHAGSTYLTSGSHGLIRIDPGGNVLTSSLSSHDRSLFATDDGVCFVAETGRVDELRCSADDGTTWTPLSLPGFR